MISVLIPLYNVEQYIARCLESILKQTYQNFEIIVVNDGSPDNSIDIVSEYANRDERIRVIENEKNMGLAWTRMVGYTHAKGDYIVFVDSDDFIPETALEVLYQSIFDNKADIAIGNYQYVDSDNNFGDKSNNKLSYGSDRNNVYRSLLINEVNHSLWGKIYKSEIFSDYKYITHEKFINAEDGFLLYQIINNITNVVTTENIVYYYYHNTKSATKIRLSDNSIWSIVTFWNLLDNMFIDNIELYPLVKDRNLKAFTYLLRKGYSFEKINKYLEIGELKDKLKFSSLTKVFTMPKAMMNYCIIKYYSFKNKL